MVYYDSPCGNSDLTLRLQMQYRMRLQVWEMVRNFGRVTVSLVLFVTSMSFSQTSPHTRNIDSLLLTTDINQVSRLLQENANAPIDTNTGITPDHRELLGKLTERSGASEERCKELSRQYLQTESRFDTLRAGKHGHLVYKKFLSAQERQMWSDAVGYYYLATYFRNRHIQDEKVRLIRNYTEAVRFYENSLYEEALRMVQEFSKENVLNPAFVILKDSLMANYQELERKAKAGQSVLQRESNAEIVTKRLAITASAGLTRYQTNANHQMVFYYTIDPSYDWPLATFGEMMKAVYSARLSYFFRPKISAGAKILVGTIYDMDVPTDAATENVGIRTHVEEKYVSFSGVAAFYPGDKTGFRSYVGLEAGLGNLRREKAEPRSTFFFLDNFKSIEEVKVSYPIIGVEFGVEYEPAGNGPVFAAISISAVKHFVDTGLVPGIVISSQFTIGLNIF